MGAQVAVFGGRVFAPAVPASQEGHHRRGSIGGNRQAKVDHLFHALRVSVVNLAERPVFLYRRTPI